MVLKFVVKDKKPVETVVTAAPVEAEEAKPVMGGDALVSMVDAIGALSLKMEKAKAVIADYNQQLKELVEAAQNLVPASPDEELSVEGEKYRLVLGPKSRQRKITNMTTVRGLMGDELFMKVATVSLKDLDDYLTPDEREKVIDVSRGSRSSKIVKLVG